MSEEGARQNKKSIHRILWLFLYFLCLYLAANLFPFSWILEDPTAMLACQFGIKTILLGYFIFECARKPNRTLLSFKHLGVSSLLWAPLVVLCFSNLFYSLAFSGSFVAPSNGVYVALLFFDDLVVAIIEEVLFRGLLFLYFVQLFPNKKRGDIYALLFSSVAFSLLHLINIFSSDPLTVLLQMGYSLVLGILLCLVYLGSQNMVLPILGHFLFNAINDTLSSSFLCFHTETTYVLWSVGFALIGLLYAIGVTIVMTKRNNRVS